MRGIECASAFDFDNDFVIYDQVGAIPSDDLSRVMDASCMNADGADEQRIGADKRDQLLQLSAYLRRSAFHLRNLC